MVWQNRDCAVTWGLLLVIFDMTNLCRRICNWISVMAFAMLFLMFIFFSDIAKGGNQIAKPLKAFNSLLGR